MANLGAGTCAPRSVNEMPRHRITTASLLEEIDRQRAEEATSRWDELTREFMIDDEALEQSDNDTAQRVG